MQFRLTRLYRAAIALHAWTTALEDGACAARYARRLCDQSLEALELVASAGSAVTQAARSRCLQRLRTRVARCVAVIEAMSLQATISPAVIDLGEVSCMEIDAAIDDFEDELCALWLEMDERGSATEAMGGLADEPRAAEAARGRPDVEGAAMTVENAAVVDERRDAAKDTKGTGCSARNGAGARAVPGRRHPGRAPRPAR